MIEIEADVAIIGSGFGGSLTALVLDRMGMRPVVVDRAFHPRFAIGESTTPIANMVLRDLADRYDLPRLRPLTKYGSAKRTYPDVTMGLKRGFSYFRHEPHEPFTPHDDHRNELLVTASHDDEHSDTHWLRADVDAFFAEQVRQAGIPLFEGTNLTEIKYDRRSGGFQPPYPRLTESINICSGGFQPPPRLGESSNRRWTFQGWTSSESIRIASDFAVDASGEAGVLLKTLNIPSKADHLLTDSWTVFGHFRGLTKWRDLLLARGGRVEDHPFGCDDAAIHQLLDDGWMWQLRFRNDVTSAGFAIDRRSRSFDAKTSAESDWNALLQKYPSLAEQFAGAELVAPAGGLRKAGRLQREATATVIDKHWAALPNTVGFIDPLQSTGIAQTMCGIERLAWVLEARASSDEFSRRAAQYQAALRKEFALIDKLVSGCYRSFGDFEIFHAYAMMYFAAATTYEHRRAAGAVRPENAFLCADDERFCEIVDSVYFGELLQDARSDPHEFRDHVAKQIAPFNIAGLCDPTVQHMYRYTAAPN